MSRRSYASRRTFDWIALTLIISTSGARAHQIAPHYSPEQQEDAVSAFDRVLSSLDQLEQKVLLAYAEGLPVIRMEEIKHADGRTHSGRDPAETPASLARKRGSSVIRRIASFEPLFANCGLSQESIHVLDVISAQTGALLDKRLLATAAERASWARAGGEEGLQRLKSAHELNCAPVRKALIDALPGLQDAYAKVYASFDQPPAAETTVTATTTTSSHTAVSAKPEAAVASKTAP